LLLDLLTTPGSALRDHPEFAADVFPKLFDQVWHDFTKAEAWEVFPETEPVIKVHKLRV
jgi:hypothetical protein